MSSPFAVQVALSGPHAPVLIEDRHAAITMLMCRREHLHLVGAEWQASGVYVRLTRYDHALRGYVGLARELLRRVEQHRNDATTVWTHVLLIRHLAANFNEAEFAFLEGALHQALHELGFQLDNVQTPGSDRLSDYDQAALREVVRRITWMLSALGWDAADVSHATNTEPLRGSHDQASVSDGPPQLAPWPPVLGVDVLRRLTVERAQRGSATPLRNLLLDGRIVGETRGTASFTLSAAAIAEATGWPIGGVRTGLGHVMALRDGDNYTRHHSLRQAIAEVAPSFGSELERSPVEAWPSDPLTLREALLELASGLAVSTELDDDGLAQLEVRSRYAAATTAGRFFEPDDEVSSRYLDRPPRLSRQLVLDLEPINLLFGWDPKLVAEAFGAIRSRTKEIQRASRSWERFIYVEDPVDLADIASPESLRAMLLELADGWSPAV